VTLLVGHITIRTNGAEPRAQARCQRRNPPEIQLSSRPSSWQPSGRTPQVAACPAALARWSAFGHHGRSSRKILLAARVRGSSGCPPGPKALPMKWARRMP